MLITGRTIAISFKGSHEVPRTRLDVVDDAASYAQSQEGTNVSERNRNSK